MAKGLYSDLDDFIEEGGREQELPSKDVQNEGNIPSGNSDPQASKQEGNIQPSDPSPEEPNRTGNIQQEEEKPGNPSVQGNIDPREQQPEAPDRRPIGENDADTESSDRESIPVSDNAPDPPQRTGNIQPRGVQNEPEGEGIDPREDNQPTSPRTRGNIRPDRENRPENPNRVEIDPDENAAPSEAERGSRGPREDAKPQSVNQSSRRAREDAAPTSPNRRVINLREEVQPKSPRKSGNIQSEERRPPSPSKRDNIEPDEELPTTEPAEDTNITARVENRPPEDEQSGNIEVNDSPPGPPQREGNINLREEVAPQEPQREDNINEADRRPQEPQREDNINEADRRPEEPEREENISPPEEPSPKEPRTQGNISPTEESEPKAPNRDENITPPEEPQPPEPERSENIAPTEESEPQEPDQDGAISPTEESEPSEPQLEDNINEADRRPQEPSRSENISPTEGSEPSEPQREDNINEDDRRPQEPDRDDFISPTEESEPSEPQLEDNINEDDRRPQEPQREDNINEDDRRPQEPQLEDNINEADRRPQEPQREDNINEDDRRPQEPEKEDNINEADRRPQEPQREDNINEDDRRPQEPQRSGNIDPENANTTDGIGGEQISIEPPLKFQSERFADQINPETAEFTDQVAGDFSSDGPESENSFQNKRAQLLDQINPNNPETTDGVGGSFQGSGDGLSQTETENKFQGPRLPDRIEAEDEPPQDFQTTGFQSQNRQQVGRRSDKDDTFEERNRVIRLQQFENFGDVNRNLSLRGVLTEGQNPGFSREPFILRRPEAGGGDLANIKQGDSRTAPVASTAEDVTRLSQFFATGKGLVYNVKQQFLQKQNPRARTKLYDPTSPVRTAAEGVASRPGQGITRHISPESGPQGIVGDVAQEIGDLTDNFDVPQSARYEDELDETATPTDWGEMRGSLFWLSPAARNPLPEVDGQEAVSRFRRRQSENVSNVEELYSSSEQEGLSRFGRQQLTAQGVVGSGYLFTETYDPTGGPQGENRTETDNYHPSAPYVQNVDSMNERFEPTAEAFNPADIRKVEDDLRDESFLFRENQRERASGQATFPYVNPTRTPDRDDVVDGDGNVQTQVQNKTTDNAYYENRTFTEDRIPVHRGVPGQDQSYGLPNYSLEDDDGNRQKRIDLINRLEPIIGETADPEQEEYGDGSYKDIIPFKFYDIENQGLIVFRAFLEGISDNLSPQWSQQDYAGRPEQAHIYGGYSNTISFSFQVAPFSEEEFEAQWKKVNYLKGLTTPASYSGATGGGAYMTPPFMRLTIGDMFNDVYGYMNSLTISVNDEMDWEIDEDVGRLPKGIEIDVDWQVIENRAPVALQKYYDAPFIDEIDQVVRESPDSRQEILPQSADTPVQAPDVDQGRAIEQSRGETLPEEDPEVRDLESPL